METGRLSKVNPCFVKYLDQRTCHSARRDWSPGISSTVFMSRRLDYSKNLYHKDLYAHYGCVNAIEFSAEGDLLVSGGDDRRVLLWNIDGIYSENKQPHAMKGEHNSNIFCLSFDSTNSKIFSAGNDEQVIVHDMKTGDLIDVFLHREAVYGVSVNPTLDSVFASAGEDGQVLLYDMRESPAADPLCIARYHDPFHSVQFHPIEPTFVVTANSREGVTLWDVRKPKVPVIRYGEKRCVQSSMCAKFNRLGTKIVALRRRMPPILYDTQYSKTICEFDAEHYYNSCTMKSCCFAGDKDQFILSGSDDFNLYMWKIPERKSFVNHAHMVLKGHRSIVNQVRFNQQNFIIASSGVEKIVKLWSGLPLPGSKGSLVTRPSGNFMSRRVYTYEEYIGLVMESGQVFGDVNHDYSHGSTDEDPRMMAFFDSLVQRELEGWTSNTDLSDEHEAAEETEPSAEDDDTETTQSSAITSQSDDNDSADGSGTSQGPSTATARGGPAAGSSAGSRCLRRRNMRSDEGADDETNKASDGSEWIMSLIAKKRAQLKAAKVAKRKRKSTTRSRKSRQKYLRSCTTTRSRRRYLYHPEGQRNEENQANGDSQRLSDSLSDGVDMRRHSLRRYMAPYTIMVVDSEVESDIGDANSDSGSETSPPQEVGGTSKRKRNIWSPSSDSSDDDNPSPSKRPHVDFSNSDSDVDDTSLQARNGHFISEIVDSNASESEVEISRIGSSSPSVGTPGVPNGETSVEGNEVNLNGVSNSSVGISNGNLGEHEGDLTEKCNASNAALPISSVSVDDSGSLSFDTDNNSQASSIETQNDADVIPVVGTNTKMLQNGEGQNGCDAASVSGENGTLEPSPSSQGRMNVTVQSNSGVQANDNLNGTDNVGSNKKVSFTFKKRMQSARNYRKQEDL